MELYLPAFLRAHRQPAAFVAAVCAGFCAHVLDGAGGFVLEEDLHQDLIKNPDRREGTLSLRKMRVLVYRAFGAAHGDSPECHRHYRGPSLRSGSEKSLLRRTKLLVARRVSKLDSSRHVLLCR